MDIEDYYFKKSEIPYTNARSRGECADLMLADIEKYRSFVISAVDGDFGDKISSFYKLAVFVSAPIDLRLKRIKQRVQDKYGKRICRGGDMYKRHLEFIDFVASRDLTKMDNWAQTLTCPVLYIDGQEDWHANAAYIAKQAEKLQIGKK